MNEDNNAKRYNARRYYLAKDVNKNYSTIINGNSFYDQPIDSDAKRYKEIKKSKKGQGEDYTTGCLLDYEYIKNHYKIIVVDMNRQKYLDSDPKAIQQQGRWKVFDFEEARWKKGK